MRARYYVHMYEHHHGRTINEKVCLQKKDCFLLRTIPYQYDDVTHMYCESRTCAEWDYVTFFYMSWSFLLSTLVPIVHCFVIILNNCCIYCTIRKGKSRTYFSFFVEMYGIGGRSPIRLTNLSTLSTLLCTATGS
jgi:hypothetical protein